MSEYAVILFSLKIKTSRPPQFRKGNMRSVQEVQSAFMRMDVNGDGSLTKREMLAADEFTPEEVRKLPRFIRGAISILAKTDWIVRNLGLNLKLFKLLRNPVPSLDLTKRSESFFR